MGGAAELRAGNAWRDGRIPVLDIGPYLAGDAGAAAPLARAVASTFEDTGFLVIANHGIPPRFVEGTFAAAAQFFARPEADKLALKIGQYNIGYLPFGGQIVRHSPVNRNTKPNFSESFYITRDRASEHPDIVNRKRLVGLNRWPPDMPDFRAAMTAYYAVMAAMTTRLVPIIAMALDLPPDYFADAFAEPNGTIRLIHYPPHPEPEENEFGFAPHTDNNFLTFLAQSALPGLEVRTAEGEWIRPPAVPGTFVVNTGAMLDQPNRDAAIDTLRRAREIGVDFLDSSDAYGQGRNEELIASAVKGHRSEYVIASKFGNLRAADGSPTSDGRPEYVKACCEHSLKRLETDVIDLYYIHRVDPTIPIEDTVGAMSELVREGKVRHLGICEAGVMTIRRAHATHPLCAVQIEYSLWTRAVEAAVLPLCEELGIGFVAYSPLGRGFLTGKIADISTLRIGDARRNVEPVLVLNPVDPAFPIFRDRHADIEQRLGTIERIGHVAGLLVREAE